MKSNSKSSYSNGKGLAKLSFGVITVIALFFSVSFNVYGKTTLDNKEDNFSDLYSIVYSSKSTLSSQGSDGWGPKGGPRSGEENLISLYSIESIDEESLESDSKTNEIDFSTMTKSELKKYKGILEEQLEAQKNIDNTKAYVNLEEQIEYVEKAIATKSYLNPYTERDVNVLAYGIYREAGSYWLKDRHRDLVGMVYVNRRNQGGINKDLNNPTLEDIMNEEGQYPYKSTDVTTEGIPEYCFESAIRCLEGKVDCPEDVVWQASFKQGTKEYERFTDSHTGVTHYFCS